MAYLFRVFLSYARNIPGIFLVYSCTFETQQFWLQQNRDWNAAAHIISIARVFNVHHSTRRPQWAHVGPGRDPRATAVDAPAEAGTLSITVNVCRRWVSPSCQCPTPSSPCHPSSSNHPLTGHWISHSWQAGYQYPSTQTYTFYARSRICYPSSIDRQCGSGRMLGSCTRIHHIPIQHSSSCLAMASNKAS